MQTERRAVNTVRRHLGYRWSGDPYDGWIIAEISRIAGDAGYYSVSLYREGSGGESVKLNLPGELEIEVVHDPFADL